MNMEAYLREHHPLLALRLDIEMYQRRLPVEQVFMLGNRFLPVRAGFGGAGVAYGSQRSIVELHLDHAHPYALIEEPARGGRHAARSVLEVATWWRDVVWLQDPGIDTGWGTRREPMFRDFLESIYSYGLLVYHGSQ